MPSRTTLTLLHKEAKNEFFSYFGKVYIYAKGWPGINLGASHESGTHPNIYPIFT